MALIAIAIKLESRGPVLFKQKRYGFNNDLIEVYKFRSMYADKTDAAASQLVTKRRSARHPRRPLHPQDQPRRTAAAVQRGDQGQSVAGRPASARGQRQGRSHASTTRRSTAISPATASSPASPAGRRSTAGAARPTRMRKSSNASSTTSTTSRTGRCCSISTSWRARRSRCSRPRTRIDHRPRHRAYQCQGAAFSRAAPAIARRHRSRRCASGCCWWCFTSRCWRVRSPSSSRRRMTG